MSIRALVSDSSVTTPATTSSEIAQYIRSGTKGNQTCCEQVPRLHPPTSYDQGRVVELEVGQAAHSSDVSGLVDPLAPAFEASSAGAECGSDELCLSTPSLREVREIRAGLPCGSELCVWSG